MSAKKRSRVRSYTPHALEDTIECLLCGCRRHHLGHHLPSAHGMTTRQYRERFPEAPTTSAHFRAIRADKKLDRDGVAYWTPERIVAAMRRWAQRTGRPPSCLEWSRGRRIRYTGSGLIGASADRPSEARVRQVFGSWSAALIAADLGPPRRRGPRRKPRPKPRTCAVPGCRRAHAARGLCGRHYQRWRRHGDPLGVPRPRTCAVPGCDGEHHARGLCRRHYTRWRRHGDPLIVHERGACGADGCDAAHYARGLCRKHYMRWFRAVHVRP
jgi:hypothetical protein